MKRINKKEPVFFTNFIRKNNPTEWNNIAEIRNDMRIYMLSGLVPDEGIEQNTISEQNFQCAYTEIDIEEDSSHIDHYRKQSLFPKFRFKWNNLYTACNNRYYGAKYKDNTYRIKKPEYQYLINPSIENPSKYFEYSFTGEILIKSTDKSSIEYQKAKLTREVFNLNEPSLVAHRQTVAKAVNEYFKQEFSIEEIKKNIGKFDSLVENVFNNLLDIEK
ncbi:MAG: retron system putative HNH endonuclease [Bacteroidota bacterium]|nr:retron system putative HNH endonuclease [Bacteroidota bacterium]